jgi:hypothetical protein
MAAPALASPVITLTDAGSSVVSDSRTSGGQSPISNLVLEAGLTTDVNADNRAGAFLAACGDAPFRFDVTFLISGGGFPAEAVVMARPARLEVNTSSIARAALGDSTPTTLADHVAPAIGDAAWTFQWDRAVGGTMPIGPVDKVAPRPAALALAGAGAVGGETRLRNR